MEKETVKDWCEATHKIFNSGLNLDMEHYEAMFFALWDEFGLGRQELECEEAWSDAVNVKGITLKKWVEETDWYLVQGNYEQEPLEDDGCYGDTDEFVDEKTFG